MLLLRGQSFKAYLGVRFFEKIQIRISESKNGFCVFLGKSKNGSWIHKIHSLWVDSSDQIQIRIFEIHNLSVFLGKDLKSIFDKRFFAKKMVGTYVGGVLLSLSHIIPCLSSIQIIGRLFLNPYLSCFWYVYQCLLTPVYFPSIQKKNHRL